LIFEGTEQQMSKKISPKIEHNNRRFYPGGAAAWTAIETDDIEEIMDSELQVPALSGHQGRHQVFPVPLRHS
jgi:hypothetical protein